MLVVGGARGIMERAGLVARLEPAIGRTLSGGHLRAGSAEPGRGMLLVLWEPVDDLKQKKDG